MKNTTNIYIIADCSFRMQRQATKLQQTFTKMQRALDLCGNHTKLHLIGYSDRAKILYPYEKIHTGGNANLAQGVDLLSSVMALTHKTQPYRTKSIFLLYAGDTVLQGWQPQLQKLFKNKDFAFGHRYVITTDTPDRYTQKAINHFVDSPDKILPYFSSNRLCSLVATVQRQHKKCA